MDMEIQKKQETPLLSRTRVTAALIYDGATPSRQDIRKELSQKLKVAEELIVIKHIFTKFGSSKAKVIAHVYEDKKMVDRIEDEDLLNKHLSKEEQKKIKEAKQKAAQEAAAAKQQKK
jgi:small subunit ribosomal protein S24e